jgi:hypothetical protein
MRRSELLEAFARDKVNPSALSSASQTKLALRFAALYERHGLIRDAIAPPLWGFCPNGADCWRAAWKDRPTEGPEDGGISLPWIGPEYEPGGVVVLGINFNDANGLTRAYEIAPADADEMAAGWRRVTYGIETYRGSDFPYRSTRSAALLIDHLAGRSIVDRESPEDVAPFIRQIIRMQAIKCSPRSDDASKPTNEMWANCPPLLLADELRVAEPGAIIGFGADVRWVLGRLAGYELRANRGVVQCGALRVAQRATPVYLIAHPRSSQWPSAHAALASLLRNQHA